MFQLYFCKSCTMCRCPAWIKKQRYFFLLEKGSSHYCHSPNFWFLCILEIYFKQAPMWENKALWVNLGKVHNTAVTTSPALFSPCCAQSQCSGQRCSGQHLRVRRVLVGSSTLCWLIMERRHEQEVKLWVINYWNFGLACYWSIT